jgi:hypothetical protein
LCIPCERIGGEIERVTKPELSTLLKIGTFYLALTVVQLAATLQPEFRVQVGGDMGESFGIG